MSQTDEETLQRICEEVEGEMGVSLQGAVFTDFAKAVARRYAETVGAGVPVDVCQRLDRALLEQNTWPPTDALTQARNCGDFCDAWQALRDALPSPVSAE